MTKKLVFTLSFAVVATSALIVLIAAPRQLTLHPLKRLASKILCAQPSTDKKKVAYFDEKGLWVINLEGGGKELLVKGERGRFWYYPGALVWSPDRSKIAFHEQVKPCVYSLKVIWVARREIREIGIGVFKRWLPDSQKVEWEKSGSGKRWTVVTDVKKGLKVSCKLEAIIKPHLSMPPAPGTPPPKINWGIKSQSSDGKKALLAILRTPLVSHAKFGLGFLEGNRIARIVELPISDDINAEVIWYPDSHQLLIVIRPASNLVIKPQSRAFLVSMDGRCQEVKLQQKGLISGVHLLDAKRHLYLYIIGGELWLGKLKQT